MFQYKFHTVARRGVDVCRKAIQCDVESELEKVFHKYHHRTDKGSWGAHELWNSSSIPSRKVAPWNQKSGRKVSSTFEGQKAGFSAAQAGISYKSGSHFSQPKTRFFWFHGLACVTDGS